MIDKRFPNWDIDVENGTIYSLKHKRYIGSEGVYNKVNGIGVHRVIWMVANGCDIPEGYDVHHIDGDKHNNSIYNLELIDATIHRSEHAKEMTYEIRRNNSLGNKNWLSKHHSEETKRKISEANKGYKHSAETKEKMSQNSTKKIKVAQYTLENELVKVWESASECQRNGFSQTLICACCKGKKKTHKGFKWKYINE